ncbi:inner centromere protein A isoform X2 [Oncorhynchus mykiss]|uniref:inner centromere protein A isoform X2 n=1 Tax=Oncorhynchus mykiss TaxID=8022 RepID=UPI0018787EA5|nr:inner centromere protein A isoform X2 [Oncorhynchus mykiss]
MTATMSSVLSSTRTLLQMFDVKIQAFANEIENDHMVWLFEIQHEANRIFSSDFSAELELMPKTPSQKKRNRRKRLSVGQNENRNKRRFSKGKRSDLRRSSVSTSLNLIAEDEGGSPVTREELVKPSRARRTKQTTQPEVASPVRSTHKGAAQTSSFQLEEAQQQVSRSISQILEEEAESKRGESSSDSFQPPCFTPRRPPLTQSHITKAVVKISASERQSAELQMNPNAERSPGRAAIKIVIAAATHFGPRRSSVRLSLAGLRNSMTQESVRRASRRSFLKKARLGSSTCSSNVSGLDGSGKQSPSSLGPRLSAKRRVAAEAKEDFQTPGKKPSPLKKSQSVRPNVRSFLHTVQKNQMMPMNPGSLGRSTVMKPFIQHTTPDRVDLKERECLKLEALKKKQEQEEERGRKKMEEEKRRKQEEMKKKKRDERLRRVVEARVKEEQKDKKILQIEKHDTLQVEHMAEEKAKEKVAAKRQDELELRRRRKRKKIQQAEEEEKKRHQELQTKRRAEEEQERTRKMAEARLAMEEEQERTRKMAEARLAMEEEQERTRKMAEARLAMEEEQERTRKMAEARLAMEEEQERTRKMAEARLAMEEEQERERRDAAERDRVKREQTFALQRDVDRAAGERERKELRMKERRRRREEQQRRAEEERHREAARQTETEAATTVATSHLTAEVETPVGKGGLINRTADIKQSPQSYEITPKGGDKPVVLNTNAEDYGMDQNSEDSTDDESAPRKPIPKWAKGDQLKQSMKRQYFNPTDVDCHYGEIEPPMLNHIFYKNKPRYLKRTSSGIWYSPPKMEALPI